MKRIGVFLSSRHAPSPIFEQAARQLGEWIGRRGYTLVYGGASKGLMDVLANTVKASGGRVIGIVPQILLDSGCVSTQNDTVFYTADLHDRKSTMIREAEVFIVFPGGIGTLDELFTVLASRLIGTCGKPVILYNIDGFWNSLLTVLNDMCANGFIDVHLHDLFSVAISIEDVERIIDKVTETQC